MNDKTKAILEITALNGQEFMDKGAIVNQTKGLNGVCIELYIPTKAVEASPPIAIDKIMQLVDDYGHAYAFVGDDRMPVARKAVLDALQSIQKPVDADSLQDQIAQAEADKKAYPLTWFKAWEHRPKKGNTLWSNTHPHALLDKEYLQYRRLPHADTIIRYEQDKIDYPEFYKQLYQVKSLSGNWVDKEHDGFSVEFEYRQHPHRENIIKFHACSEADKKRWECCNVDENGMEITKWYSVDNPSWDDDCKYRMRPRVCFITLQDGTKMEYPDPVREALVCGQEYWVALKRGIKQSKTWNDNGLDDEWLKDGVVHLTEEAAKQHLSALQAMNAQIAI